MAGLLNKGWGDVKASFSDSNQAMGNAIQSLSSAGNIFDKVATNFRAMEQMRLEDIAKHRQLDIATNAENRQQQQLDYEIDSDKQTAQALSILTAPDSVNNDGSLTPAGVERLNALGLTSGAATESLLKYSDTMGDNKQNILENDRSHSVALQNLDISRMNANTSASRLAFDKEQSATKANNATLAAMAQAKLLGWGNTEVDMVGKTGMTSDQVNQVNDDLTARSTAIKAQSAKNQAEINAPVTFNGTAMKEDARLSKETIQKGNEGRDMLYAAVRAYVDPKYQDMAMKAGIKYINNMVLDEDGNLSTAQEVALESTGNTSSDNILSNEIFLHVLSQLPKAARTTLDANGNSVNSPVGVLLDDANRGRIENRIADLGVQLNSLKKERASTAKMGVSTYNTVRSQGQMLDTQVNEKFKSDRLTKLDADITRLEQLIIQENDKLK